MTRLVKLGFQPFEQRELAAVDMAILRLRPPPGMAAMPALAMLRSALPESTADLDSLYESYATQGLSSAEVASLPSRDYARHMVDWPNDGACGGGIRIGMIDTAPASVAALTGPWLHRRSFADGAGSAAVSSQGPASHGTAIALLLAGRAEASARGWRGLLPEAQLYAADVFGPAAGSKASALALASALDWMVANRIPVVNLSVSGQANLILELAIRRAQDRGTIVVAAAGNGGPSAPPAYPAAFPGVIAVTAVDQTSAVLADANRGDYIDFAAPGVRIWIPEGARSSGRLETGTSFAAPFVTAMAALELGPDQSGDAARVLRGLAARSTHLGPPGKNPIYGYGLPRIGGGCAVAAAQAPVENAIQAPILPAGNSP